MLTQIIYEWTCEEIEDGDIVNSDFSDSVVRFLPFCSGVEIGLVRNEGNENEGVTGRQWAYVKDGKLPEYFSDANGNQLQIKVPNKFVVEPDLAIKKQNV